MDQGNRETKMPSNDEIIRQILERKGPIPVLKLCRIDAYETPTENWIDVRENNGDIAKPSTKELIKFATDFRMRRIQLGLTQKNVTEATSTFDHTIRSVTILTKFESFELTLDCAMIYYPYLCLWMDKAEAAKAEGGKEFEEFLYGTKIRRKLQKCFPPRHLEQLNAAYANNPIPAHKTVRDLMWSIGCSEKSIHDWFSNNRRIRGCKIKQTNEGHKQQEEKCNRLKLKKEKATTKRRCKNISILQNKIDEMTKRTTDQELKFVELFPNKKVNSSNKRKRKHNKKQFKSLKRKSLFEKKQPNKFQQKIDLLKKKSLAIDKEIEKVLDKKIDFSKPTNTS